ncbi:DUF1963 domain-containing protein [Actinocorallia populi]|uniref:DUF1963 domain-containing protein n=1 Tax=Actinocorallia populi TaxID=2079200 RepID=UPI00130049FE|nr:YwqG family protein [Actinocorallia populi]
MEITSGEELRSRLVEAADKAPLPPAAHQALGLLRPSLSLTPAEGEGSGGTRFGGLPPLPAEAEWPTFDGRPLTFLAQLDCAALHPLLGDDWPLPHDGLLLFFHDDTFADFQGSDAHVLHVPGDAPERPAPPETAVIPVLPLSAARTLSLPPSYAAVVADFLDDYDLIEAMDAVAALHAVLPQIDYRVLGWHDNGMLAKDDFSLLQLEAVPGVDWGEAVNVAFWITGEDLAAGRLDRAATIVEVA